MIMREALRSNNRYRAIPKPRMIVDICDIYGGVYFYGKEYEPETTSVILRLLRPGDVVLDIGANLGYYSFLMAEAVGAKGQIHAFEPNPSLAKVFRESLKMSASQDSIVFNEIAVADGTAQTVEFYLSQYADNSGLSSLYRHQYGVDHGFFSSKDKVLVETITLDDYFRKHHLSRCDLIKIDVEGAEPNVIRGMAGVLRDVRPKFVICETNLNEEADHLMRGFDFLPHVITAAGVHKVQANAKFWGNVLYASVQAVSEGLPDFS